MEATSDELLLESIRSGTRLDEALKTIYRDYFKILAPFVTNNNGSFEDAEDVFQETIISFITIVRNGKFRGQSSVKTFLYSINRNTWLNRLKKKKKTTRREMLYTASMPVMEFREELAVQREQVRAQVTELLEKLGLVCQKILVQYYYDDLPVRQITANLGMNPQVVKNKKCKCQKELTDMIRNNPDLNKNLRELLLSSMN